MKKNTLLIITIALSFFNTSCHRTGNIETTLYADSLFQVITIDPDALSQTERSKISTIAENIEYIPLQTTDSILIGHVKKMVVWQGDLYIWDKQTESIYLFDANGKFKNKVSKQGGGPEEYPRIYDFEVDRQNGNIWIYSDITGKFYQYTTSGEFVKQVKSPVLISSFAVHKDWKYCYLGRSANMDYYKATYPQMCRYMALLGDEPQYQELAYEYKDIKVPLSNSNYSFYKDTVLLTEFLKPMVYSIDTLGQLHPRYRIEFTTNTISLSFDEEIDMNAVKSAEKSGNYTYLFGSFFETDKYIFFNYARGLIGTGYVDKSTGIIHNQGYFLEDDFNTIGLPVSISFVDEDYMYKTVEPRILLKNREKGNLSSYLEKVCQSMQEFNNPVIVRIKLKK